MKKVLKEKDKMLPSNIFEGIVSFRAVIESQDNNVSDRKIKKVFYLKDNLKRKPKEFSFIKAKSYERHFEIELCDDETIDCLTLGNSHGGLVFECTERTLPELEKESIKKCGFYFMLDGVEDPYNFGYALRTLFAAGVDGIVLSKSNWMGASGVVCRASAGASEKIEMFISNGNHITLFKDAGYKIVCADIDNSKPMYDASLKYPLLLIVGGEKRGINSAVLQSADEIVRIEYGREFPAALSAASASSVLAFEVLRQNR